MSGENKAKIAIDLFTRGNDALKKGNFDYAVKMFLDCCKLVPDKLIYRQSLRGAERKKFKDNKKGAAMASMWTLPVTVKLKTAKARKQWKDVIDLGEEALQYNPWDPKFLHEVGNACNELEYLDVGIWVLETAVDVDKETAAIYWLLARMYEQAGEFTKAITTLEKLVKINPTEYDASSKIRQLAASNTIEQGKYEKGGGALALAGDAPAAREGGDAKEIRVKKEAETLEDRFQADPTNHNLCVQIADTYQKHGDYHKAAEMFQRALNLTGGMDRGIQLRLLDCHIEPLRQNIESIKHQLETMDRSAAGAAQKFEMLNQQRKAYLDELHKREVELFRFRIENNPQDTNSHYELGYRYLQLKQFDEAIKSLQLARGDLKRKWEALYWTGVAFTHKRNPVLAEKNLKDALEAAPAGQDDAKKTILYALGRLCEDRKRKDEALQFYNEVASIDYGYKDVAKRLDELNAEEPAK